MKRLGDARSRHKKAVSAVVATVLIVMITVAAIGIIWIAIIPMIRDNLGSSDVCRDAGVSIISSQGYTCYKPNNITMVQVSKGSTKANVTGLKFSISSGGNSYDYDEQTVAYATTDYDVFYLNTSEFEKIEKISVVPSVKSGDSEESCSVIYLEDIPLCSSNVNLVAVSAGRLIGRSGSNNPNVGTTCVPNCSCANLTPKGETCRDTNCGTDCDGLDNCNGSATDLDCWSTNQGNIVWGPREVTDATSPIDGRNNTANLASRGPSYAAAYTCAHLVEGGYPEGTWYLPAYEEISQAYEANLRFYNEYIWSSTEMLSDPENQANLVSFAHGGVSNYWKDVAEPLFCLR